MSHIVNVGGALSAITVGASAFTYTNNLGTPLMVLVSGGTVTTIEYGRAGVFATVGLIGGQYQLQPGDSLRVTYAVIPTMSVMAL